MHWAPQPCALAGLLKPFPFLYKSASCAVQNGALRAARFVTQDWAALFSKVGRLK